MNIANQTLYDLISVSTDASQAEIKEARFLFGEKYRHDKNRGDENAAKMFDLFEKAFTTLTDPAKRAAYDKSIELQAECSKDLPPPLDGAAKRNSSPELRGKNEVRQMKEEKKSTGGRLEMQVLQEARQMFLDTKTDFLRRLTEAPAEFVELRRSAVEGFDNLIESVLCEIASADGPINAVEAEVIGLLLGKQKGEIYYNQLLKQPGRRDIDNAKTFGTMIDVAIQLGAIEQSSDYDPQNDPVVKCCETLGLAVVSADKDVSQRELGRLSKFTAIAHSHAAKIDRRIQSLTDASDNDSSDKTPTTQVGKSAVEAANAPSATLEQCIAELHSLVGLSSVKDEVETLTNLARVFRLRKEKGLPVPDMSFHMVFSGNPGTGKTTVARIVAKTYGCLGLLAKGHLVEVDRSGLVGNYVGQTSNKTKKLIDQAKGGILFIDEAYALAKDSENDYGHEAIEILLKAMEDYRDDLVIIAAGYTDRMATFLGSNPGLRSRFPRVVSFPDYSAEELEEIFRREANRSGYRIADEAQTVLKGEMVRLWQQRGPDFANARDVRNLFERVVAKQANRVSGSSTITTEILTTITEADVRLACSLRYPQSTVTG